MKKYDVVIVGANLAGIFTAIEMLKSGTKQKILIVENGKAAKNRHYPNLRIKTCTRCKSECHGFEVISETAKFSYCEVYNAISKLVGERRAKEIFDCTNKIYMDLAAEHITARQLYAQIEGYLLDSGVDIMFETECDDIIVENGRCVRCTGVICSGSPVYALNTVIASDVSEKIRNSYRIEKFVEGNGCFNTGIKCLYYLGNYCGFSECPMMASAVGVMMGNELYRYEFTQKVMMGDRAY